MAQVKNEEMISKSDNIHSTLSVHVDVSSPPKHSTIKSIHTAQTIIHSFKSLLCQGFSTLALALIAQLLLLLVQSGLDTLAAFIL